MIPKSYDTVTEAVNDLQKEDIQQTSLYSQKLNV